MGTYADAPEVATEPVTYAAAPAASSGVVHHEAPAVTYAAAPAVTYAAAPAVTYAAAPAFAGPLEHDAPVTWHSPQKKDTEVTAPTVMAGAPPQETTSPKKKSSKDKDKKKVQ